MDEQVKLSPNDLAALAVSNPTAFARAFAILILGADNDELDSDRNGVACIWNEVVGCNPELHEGITATYVDGDGGSEGGGESVERVYQIEHEGKTVCFLRSTGSYYSHEGIFWDNSFEIVYPHEVLVTQYRITPQVKA